MKPRLDIDKNAPVAVTLFSGGGGVECGLIEAGIRPVCAVEFDPTKPELSASLADMHDRNFKEYGCKLIRRSVQDVARLNFPGIPRTPDFLHASPVCSNFSPAKTGGEETQVDIDCAEAVAKAIATLKPKFFTLEQVPRYQKSRSWEIIKSQLDADGYQTTIAVCNMADWGLPQARVRMVVLACKDFLPELPPKQDRVSWYEAIANLIPSMPDSNLVKAQVPLAKGKNPLFIHRTCEIRAVPSDRCANTIRRSFFTDQNGNNRNKFADIWLPDGTVKQVTIPAIARLQGFPEWYELDPCLAVSGQMLGYSVPPYFAAQLFSSLLASHDESTTCDSTINVEEIAKTLLVGNEGQRFTEYLVEYLNEAYGIRRSSAIPDIDCFVNTQARTYQGEVNNICGSIQLSPGRVGGSKEARKTVTKVPESTDSLPFSDCKLLYDSLAFTDVLTNDRQTPAIALERQLSTLGGMPKSAETWIVSYDRLIDEKFVDGARKKQRWTVEEGEKAVQETVEAAKYLDSQRDRLGDYTLVMSCQGVDAPQYEQCVARVLAHCKPQDVVGLGGWCILGRQPSYLNTFWETINRVIPLIALAGVKRVHIFGVTWYKEKSGFPLPPLAPLLWLCDRHGIKLSTDGTSPIGNALWKNTKKSNAFSPYWRHNLAYVKASLATIRDKPTYQAPPGCQFVDQQTEAIESTCGLQISFGWTAQYLPAKTVTRRDWKDSHAEKFIRAYERGDRIVALDKDKRYGGKQIGWCKLACLPYKEKLSDMPISDLVAEGGMVDTTKEFIDKYFDGNSSKEVWVIRFEFTSLPTNENQLELMQSINERKAKATIQDFLANTKQNGDCLIWQGALDRQGYTKHSEYRGYKQSPKTIRVSRKVLELKLGRPIRDGYQANHSCDNPSCINPEHLWEGTQTENRQDCLQKGRTKGVADIGSRHSKAKLSETDIPEILELSKQGIGVREIARQYGLNHGTILRIIDGKGWQHVARHSLDRYDSPHWFVTAVAPYVGLNGTIGECCYGSGILSKCLKTMGFNVWGNDIDSNVETDFHFDVTLPESWNQLPAADWIYSNIPFGADAAPIVKNAYNHAKRGIVMMLRTTWEEPCDDRGEWLYNFPYTRKIILPRFKFRKGNKNSWATDNCTIAAYIWDKQITCLPSISLPASKIQLFHDNPENGPSWGTIEFTFKPAMEVEIEPRKCPMGDAHTGYLYQRKKGDRLIWEYRYNYQNHYVPVGKFGRVKNAIVNGLSGDRTLATVFKLKESSVVPAVDVNSLCQ
jgi:site-specific DNA-cytosine methylase